MCVRTDLFWFLAIQAIDNCHCEGLVINLVVGMYVTLFCELWLCK